MIAKDVEPLAEDLPESTEFSKHEAESTKNMESSPKFDPKMSSREMRKIKYYEDRFARMEDENKSSSSSVNVESGPGVHKTRPRAHEKRRSMDQKAYQLSSMDGYRQDSTDSTTYTTTSRPGRKPANRRVTTSSESNNSNNSKYEELSSEIPSTDKKSLLDNKRLIRVQSMPTVTKKVKTAENDASSDKLGSETPVQPRRNRVSRWDVKYVTKSSEEPPPPIELPHVTKEEVVESELPKEDNLLTEIPEDALKPALDQQVKSEESFKETNEHDIRTPMSDVTDFSFDQDTKDLPLDVDEFLNEEDDQVQEPKVEEEPEPEPEAEAEPEPEPEPLELEPEKIEPEYPQYDLEEQVIHVPVKKKSNRGRKAKNRRTVQVVAPIQEHPSDPDKSLLEDLTPAAETIEAPPEIIDEVKPVIRTRTKSHRTRRKRQEYYEPERAVSRAKHTNKSKSSHKSHSGASEKQDKSHGHLKGGEASDERFISIEKLRMITLEEAEKMINLCRNNDKDMENLKNAIRNLGSADSESLSQEKESRKRRQFLLDPSNIVAPNLDYNQEVEVQVPEDPLKLSFKYRLFHQLNKL